MNIFKKIIDNINYYSSIIKFKNHNQKIFKKKNYSKKRIIFVEHYPIWNSLIPYSYLSNVLSKKYNARIVSYTPFMKNFLIRIMYYISFKIGIYTFSITKSFGVEDLLIPKKLRNLKEYNILINKINKIKSKEEILKLVFLNIKIGDLLYDGFLYKHKVATVTLNKKFFEYAREFVYLFLYWHYIFSNNKVLGLIASHPIREYGIPLRIAAHSNIHSYTTAFTFVYKHSKKKINHSFYDYKSAFDKLPKKEKIKGISQAKKELYFKFKGKQTKDTVERIEKDIKPILQYSKLKKINKNSQNILIALHSMYDAPHVYGNWIFNDQYEYLKFLGKKSNELKQYNWLIKIHPVLFDKEIHIVKDIIKYYPRLKLLKKNITNANLLKKGVKCVLTAHGNIAYEFAYLGIPSILCSKHNPFRGFKFIKDVSNVKAYNKILNNLDDQKYKIDINDVYSFYYIRFLKINAFFPNFKELYEKIGDKVNTPLIYDEWLKIMNNNFHKRIFSKIEKFTNSNKFFLSE